MRQLGQHRYGRIVDRRDQRVERLQRVERVLALAQLRLGQGQRHPGEEAVEVGGRRHRPDGAGQASGLLGAAGRGRDERQALRAVRVVRPDGDGLLGVGHRLVHVTLLEVGERQRDQGVVAEPGRHVGRVEREVDEAMTYAEQAVACRRTTPTAHSAWRLRPRPRPAAPKRPLAWPAPSGR